MRLSALVAAVALIGLSAAPLTAQDGFYELIRPSELPAFEAGTLTGDPAYPTPGEAVVVTLEVIDRSERPDCSARQVPVALFADGEMVATTRVDLGSGARATATFRWVAPSVEGLITLTARIDPDRRIEEQLRIDNDASRQVAIAAFRPGTELSVEDVEVVSEGTRPGLLRAAVRNLGGAPATAPLAFRVDGRPEVVRLAGPIEEGESTWVEIPWPRHVPVGRLEVEASPRHGELERNPDDNRWVRDLRPAVDLRVEDLSLSTLDSEEGEPRRVTVGFQITNGGRAVVATPFATRISVFSTERAEPRVALLRQDGPDEGLSPGESAFASRTFEELPGRFEVVVETDALGQLDEDDETNNVAHAHFENPTPNVGRWVSVGPTRIQNGANQLDSVGRLFHIAIDPDHSSTLYVGSTSQAGNKGGSGVWKTTSGGTTWQPVADGLDSLSIAALAIDPSKSQRIYVATLDAGFYRSETGGAIWHSLDPKSGSPQRLDLRSDARLLIAPNDPKRLFVNTKGGVFRSTNSGETWQKVLDGDVTDLVLDPADPQHLWAGLATDDNAAHFATAGVYETTQGGDVGSWHKLSGCGGNTLPAFSAKGYVRLALSGATLYTAIITNGTFSVFRTTSSTCSSGSGPAEHGWEARFSEKGSLSNLFADPKDPKYVYASAAGAHFRRSEDGAKSFSAVSGPRPHIDHHGFAIDPKDSKVVYVATDGGIYRSPSRGKDRWEMVGDGIVNAEIYDLELAATDPTVMIAGTQDNGNIERTGTDQRWRVIAGAGGDGATVAIDPGDKGTFYTQHQHAGTLRRHGSGGVECIGCGLPYKCYFNQFGYVVDPNATTRLVGWCKDELWTGTSLKKCTTCPNMGHDKPGAPAQWTKAWTAPAADGNITRLVIDGASKLHYLGTSSGNLFASKDGTQWEPLFPTRTFASSVSDIEVDEDDPTVLYVSYGTGNAHRVYRMTRTGTPPPALPTAATLSRKDITSDLEPGVKVHALAIDPLRDHTLYAATNRGVFQGRSFDAGATWTWSPYRQGMPRATHVSDLELVRASGVLVAATHGRGVYSVYTHSNDVFVEIRPGSRTVSPGSSTSYTVDITNMGSASGTWLLSVSGLPQGWYSLGQITVTAAPGQTATVNLAVTVPPCADEEAKVFTVTALSQTPPQSTGGQYYGQDQARLVIAVPDAPLPPDAHETNDAPTPTEATPLALGATRTPVSRTLTGLTLHDAKDVDWFRVTFQSTAKGECTGGSKGIAPGATLRPFEPHYTPGHVTVHAREENCREMNVEVRLGDGTPYKSYRTGKPIPIDCPTQALGGKTLYVGVHRKEQDRVRYDLSVQYSGWSLSVHNPLPDLGLVRVPIPPDLVTLEPSARYTDPVELFRDLDRDALRFDRYRRAFEGGDLEQRKGGLSRLAGDLDAAAEHLQRSVELFAEAGAPAARGNALRELAQVHLEADRRQDALRALRQAMDLHAELGDAAALASDRTTLAALYLAGGDAARALAALDEALATQRARHDVTGQIENLEAQIDAFLALDRPEAAVACLVLLRPLVASAEAAPSSGSETGPETLTRRQTQLEELLGPGPFGALDARLGPVAETVRAAGLQAMNDP